MSGASKKSERRGSSASATGGAVDQMSPPRVSKKMRTDSTSPTLAAAAAASAAAAAPQVDDQASAAAQQPALHAAATPSPVSMQTSPDAPVLPSPLSVAPMHSASPAASITTPTPAAATATNSAASGSGSGSGGDMRSVLKQAALERAARNKRAPSTSPVAGSAAASAAATAGQSPLVQECISPPASANSVAVAGRPLRAPGHLRLNIASPQGSGSGSMQIATPVIYTGADGALASGAVSASPKDELAGFSGAGASFPSYATPPSLPVSAPSSGSGGPMLTSPAAGGSVVCPLCARPFPLSVIEAHAAACDGQLDQSQVHISDMPVAASARTTAAAAAAATAAPPAHVSSVAPTSFSITSTPPTIPLPFFPRHHDSLRLLTWNCWFDDFMMSPRMDAIGSVITAEQPHIVALQEVTDASLAMIQRSEWARHYHCSSTPPAPYFTVLLSKFPMQSLRRLPFQSQMARDLLCCTVEVPTNLGPRRLSVATSHLESERKRSHVRRQQLDAALRLLSQAKQHTPTALFVGDMNLAGSELADVPARYGWLDAWLHAHGSERGAERRGATYDTKANTMLESRNRTGSSGYQARLDRIWIRLGSGENLAKTAAAAAAGSADSSSAADSSAAPVAAAAPAGPTPLVLSSGAAPPAPSSPGAAAAAEWRVVSLERVGLCPIDVSQAKRYAQTRNYKQLESPSAAALAASAPASAVAASAASASASAAPAAAAVTPRGLSGWGSLSGSSGTAASSTPVFPSDHFGLLITLQIVNSNCRGDAPSPPPGK